jgi:23S rRNA G2445 N2-methylase RlmL
MRIFALTTRGLEQISADELRVIPGARIRATAYRRVEADYQGPLAALLALATVDDVFLHLADWAGIGRPRETLGHLRRLAATLEIEACFPPLRTVRPLPRTPTFSLTANFVGKRNYAVPEIKQAAAEGIQMRYPGWVYAEDDREADLNVRLFIEHDQAVVGLRIAAESLHRRAYKQQHLPGSLKPPVAAAMIRLAGLRAGQQMLDPFCGAGTILIEAIRQGIAACGGDYSAEALEAAAADARLAGVPVTLAQWDARRLPFADSRFDGLVSNMPWGRQVAASVDLSALYRAAFAEMQRVVMPGGVLALLTSAPELLPAAPDQQIEISLFGQNPSVAVYRLP